jgi:glutamine cyclotransferase
LKKWHSAIVLAALALLILSPVVFVLLNQKPSNPTSTPHYAYSVVNTYPHDRNAFTEGLVYENGFLYESTGLYGQSTLRRVQLETGNVLQSISLPNQYFGEGTTIFGNNIIQLTWQSHKGFVYDKNSFDMIREFSYPTEGWGITNDGNKLIMSDGSDTLYFLDPQSFNRTGQIKVQDAGAPVNMLNELEYINEEIYANIWMQQKIAIINPQTGQVTSWIDLTGITNYPNLHAGDVLNGIAYDAQNDRLFITGKDWNLIFQIKIIT